MSGIADVDYSTYAFVQRYGAQSRALCSDPIGQHGTTHSEKKRPPTLHRWAPGTPALPGKARIKIAVGKSPFEY
jgi:hypothetical protein